MALFGRDYDRNYSNRGTGGYNRGYDRGIGGTARYAWNETKDETREGWNAMKRGGRNMTDNDYDRGFNRGGQGGTYGNAYGGGGYGATRAGYDRDVGYGNTDRNYGFGAGYDRNFHSRAETDYGDPFGDRTSHTPIRVMRGEFHNYDRGYRRNAGNAGNAGNANYDRNYSANPVGYDPGYGGNNRYDRNF